MDTDGQWLLAKDYEPLEPICEGCIYEDKYIDHLLKRIEQYNGFSLLKNYYSKL
jgi:hypothetical protein